MFRLPPRRGTTNQSRATPCPPAEPRRYNRHRSKSFGRVHRPTDNDRRCRDRNRNGEDSRRSNRRPCAVAVAGITGEFAANWRCPMRRLTTKPKARFRGANPTKKVPCPSAGQFARTGRRGNTISFKRMVIIGSVQRQCTGAKLPKPCCHRTSVRSEIRRDPSRAGEAVVGNRHSQASGFGLCSISCSAS